MHCGNSWEFLGILTDIGDLLILAQPAGNLLWKLIMSWRLSSLVQRFFNRVTGIFSSASDVLLFSSPRGQFQIWNFNGNVVHVKPDLIDELKQNFCATPQGRTGHICSTSS